MPRKSSVHVQMEDDPAQLPSFEELLASHAPTSPPKPPPDPDPAPGAQPFEPEDPPFEPEQPVPAGEPDDPVPTDDDPEEGADFSQTPAAVSVQAPPAPAHPLRYESRIVIVDAWRYSGSLRDAPDWIDRNWAAFADSYDTERKLEPGPALRVPRSGSLSGDLSGGADLCRVGDYVAQQQVTLAAGLPPETRVEVWEAEQFRRLFLPVSA